MIFRKRDCDTGGKFALDQARQFASRDETRYTKVRAPMNRTPDELDGCH